MDSYDTAEEALISIGIGGRLEKRKCTAAIKKVTKACIGSLSCDVQRLKECLSLDDVHGFILNSFWRDITGKCISVGQTLDGSVVVWGECYGVSEFQAKNIEKIIACANKKGIEVTSFVKTYPHTSYDNAWRPHTKNAYNVSRMRCLYRGTLIGVVIHVPQE